MMGGCAGPSDRSSALCGAGLGLIAALPPAEAGGRPRTTRCSSRGSSGASSASAHRGRGPSAPARASPSRWSTRASTSPTRTWRRSSRATSAASAPVGARRRAPGRVRTTTATARTWPASPWRPRATAGEWPAWRPTPACWRCAVLENSCDERRPLHRHRVRRRRRRRDPLGRRPRRRRHQPQPRRRHAPGRPRLRVLRRRRVRVVEGRDRGGRGRQRLRAAAGLLRRARRDRHRHHARRRPERPTATPARACSRRPLAGVGPRRRGGDGPQRLRDRRHAEGHPVHLLGRGRAERLRLPGGHVDGGPHVSGALAVLRSTGLSPQASVDRLLQTAQDLGAPGRDGEFGVGRIDLGRAVGTAPGGTSTTSSVPGTSTTDPTSWPAASARPPPPGGTTTTAPPVSLPQVAAPAPFEPAAPPVDGDELPAGLVGLAMWRSSPAAARGGHGSAARPREPSRPAGPPPARAYGGAPPPAP